MSYYYLFLSIIVCDLPLVSFFVLKDTLLNNYLLKGGNINCEVCKQLNSVVDYF